MSNLYFATKYEIRYNNTPLIDGEDFAAFRSFLHEFDTDIYDDEGFSLEIPVSGFKDALEQAINMPSEEYAEYGFHISKERLISVMRDILAGYDKNNEYILLACF